MATTNIGQKRAKAAWGFAQDQNSAYASYVRKFPMYIKTNGLINAVAFAYSKGKEWEILYKNIEEYFKQQHTQILTFTDKDSLIQVLINADENTLRMATAETLALFTWLKRFVKDEELDNKKS